MPNDADVRMNIYPMANPAPSIEAVATSITAFVGQTSKGPIGEPVEIASFTEFATYFTESSAGTPLSFSMRQFFENDGERAIVVRVIPGRDQLLRDEDLVPSEGVDSRRGIYALERADLFNLLVLPPLNWDVDVAPATWAAAAAFCHRRRAFLIIDAPVNAAESAVEAGKAGFDSVSMALPADHPAAANAGCYFPRVIGQVGVSNRAIAASGAIAGVIARTDRTRGVWTAPAAMEATLQGVSKLYYAVNDSENSVLNQLGVNCLRTFPGQAPVIWGARTMQGGDEHASDWKYVPVRRLALHIEESLYRGTRWAAFEPNDEPLWARLRLSAGNFLHDLYQSGAFPGQTPNRAYFVKCDSATTTQTDIDNGVVNIVVGFAPLKPAEFVIVRIQQRAGAGDQRIDPYRAFRFRLMMDDKSVAGFDQMTKGVATDIGDGRLQESLQQIVLERGMTQDADFEEWAKMSTESDEQRRDLTVFQMNEAGQLEKQYLALRAWVSVLQAIRDLDANANTLSVQHMQLECDGWEELPA